MSNGHLWSKFWWQDWQNDPALRQCSFAAQGLWMRLLCLAHEAVRRGSVLINGRMPTPRQLVAQVGGTEREVAKLLGELEREGVFSRDPDGTIYSRRMRRDDEASEAGREHIAKRWKDPKPTSHPNRGATTKPNGMDHSPPTPEPITPEADTDSEAEAEERKGLTNKNSLPPSSSARAKPQQSDALDELLDEAGIEKPRLDRSNDAEKLSDNPALEAQLRRTARVLAMSIPYGEVRSAEAQIAANEAQPAAVGADVTMGLRWQPADPVLDRDQQIAAALAAATPEQIEMARRYTERISRFADA